MRALTILVLVSFHCFVSAAEVDIDVVGLFKEAALFRIDGETRMMRVGDRTREGIVLVSADSSEAVVELDGKRMTLTLSSHIGARFEPPSSTVVTISLNDFGQYRTEGSINEKRATFVVDTGANIVALNSNHARTLGIQYTEGTRTRAVTAGGYVASWAVVLGSVQVGDIRLTNVRAAVLEGDFPQDILLGMSFLSGVEIREDADVMVLTRKL